MQTEPLKTIKLSFQCPKQLNQLQPCNGDWYCDGCQKIVYDFRGMSETQILQILSTKQTACGVFDAVRIEVLSQQNRWLRWASAAMLALGLTGLHNMVMAQTKPNADTVRKSQSFLLGKIRARAANDQNFPSIKVSEPIALPTPSYPGGDVALLKFIVENIKHIPHYEGKIIIQFTVEADSSLTNFKILQSGTKDLDEQIINALKKSPQWKPALQNGKPYPAQYTLPVKIHQ